MISLSVSFLGCTRLDMTNWMHDGPNVMTATSLICDLTVIMFHIALMGMSMPSRGRFFSAVRKRTFLKKLPGRWVRVYKKVCVSVCQCVQVCK